MPRRRSGKADADPPRARPEQTRERAAGKSALANFLVVGIGASAGGLDACTKLVEAVPKDIGMAFILVQHLDPTHESMMVDLLAARTSMTVRQAAEGMPVERDHLYVIPPGRYLSVVDGILHLSKPLARHGARLPFDFLLRSLAQTYGRRAVCVVLSGTGADGSLGLSAVKEQSGLVIAQDPAEASYGGMPQSAILTGSVDFVLPAARIPDALLVYNRQMSEKGVKDRATPHDEAPQWLSDVVELLRTRTAHDFTLYKPGTLQRRIERRMQMAAIPTDDVDRYLDRLRADRGELDLLAKDLLIHVTSFFRDRDVFDLLEEQVVPGLLDGRTPDRALRVWIAGCSTGEETYSLAMLFHERIAASNRNIKLQFFASDVDPDAVATAREGLYPDSIEAEVSPARLARFFIKEEHGYRVVPELRASVVFAVQDVLADPPFSRLDLVSCRNLLIYLRPEAQEKVISLFDFGLREGGILLLGGSETIGNADGRFEAVSKSARLYRHVARSQPAHTGFAVGAVAGLRRATRPGHGQPPSRQAALAELCRRLVLETHAPAAVLIDRKSEVLYSLGPTDRYLQVAPGHPSHDLLAMVRGALRTRLRSAIQQAAQKNTRVVVSGVQTTYDGRAASFAIDVLPVEGEAEELFLICFVDEPKREPIGGGDPPRRDPARVGELERDLESTRAELEAAIRSLELSNEDQKAVNEEALSINEEYQSTNEELLTSKEELQSLNEELTALNSQLQETLERQRTTANDLQNVLNSTDVATLFLDPALNIRLFTPATRALFNVISSDVGRPLADLNSLAADAALLTDARTVLRTQAPIEREIEARSGSWYFRRVLPYRTQDNGVEGVVITFADITERRHVAEALATSKLQAELATAAKSRFLAAASHDLRQPMQTLVLIQGLLANFVEGHRGQELLARLDDTLSAMSGMLNTLLDINRIEAGTLRADVVDFPVEDLMHRLRDEFAYHAQAKGIVLKTVACGLSIRSDPRLLEQMIRNLLSNAFKYTSRGKVLFGCRRRQDTLSIEIWDTGIGIPDNELQTIFEEYHQVGDAARERDHGLGLGLAIVQSLGRFLDHRIRVRSTPGKGSVFAIDVKTARGDAEQPGRPRQRLADAPAGAARRTGAILVVEDDPTVRELLVLLLEGEGHRLATAPDGATAMELIGRGSFRPDLILADYSLPGGVNGVEVARLLRETLHRQVPVVVLSGAISTDALRDIARMDCVRLAKPVKPVELTRTIGGLLSTSPGEWRPPAADGGEDAGAERPVIFVVEDDDQVREAVRAVLENAGHTVEAYASAEAFIETYRQGREGCLLVDFYLPGMSGQELLRWLQDSGQPLPAIMITGNSDVPMAIDAMKSGASDFIEKPVGRDDLLAGIERALERSRDASKLAAWHEEAAHHLAGLTPRQRQILERVLAGQPSKNIAADLGISQRTVENHRAAIMKRTGSKSIPALARLALAATAVDPA